MNLELVFQFAETPGLPAQFKCSKYRIRARESNKAGTRECPIGVDSQLRVLQTVLSARLHAGIAGALQFMGLGNTVASIQKQLDYHVVVAVRGEY